jgi:hypothetical protein
MHGSMGPHKSVENGFSVLNSMLNDRRMSKKAETMENLFLIQFNKDVWKPTTKGGSTKIPQQ